jgi:anthranilate phosphoribosyltransferase
MDFFKYIHAVGTGAKGNRDLSFEESKDMMQQMLNQTISIEQSASFLLGWRLKPETTTEFLGVLSACDDFIKKTTIKNSIELGYPYDGKVKNPYIFSLVGKILKDVDLSLVISGDRLTPAKGGITIKEICKNIELSSNTHYFNRANFFAQMSNLTDIRMNLGLRSGINTIEKLTGVGNSEFAITGVFHKPYVKKYIEIFAHRYKRFAVIQGNEGTPELFSKGRLWMANGDDVDEFIIDPKRYNINYQKSWQKISLDESISQIKDPSKEYLKLAKLNGAIWLFVTNQAKDIDQAWEILN